MAFADTILAETNRTADDWKNRERLDVHHEMCSSPSVSSCAACSTWLAGSSACEVSDDSPWRRSPNGARSARIAEGSDVSLVALLRDDYRGIVVRRRADQERMVRPSPGTRRVSGVRQAAHEYVAVE